MTPICDINLHLSFYIYINLSKMILSQKDRQRYEPLHQLVLTENHINYLHTHPELRYIANDFLKLCLEQQPGDIRKFAGEYYQVLKKKNYGPLVISGCSGAGKGTLVKFLLANYPQIFQLSVSYTTRPRRTGQQHGKDYFFVSKEAFQAEVEKGVFAEHGQVHSNYYGTHKDQLKKIKDKGKICLLDIDLVAGEKFKNQDLGCTFLWIDVPCLEDLEARMIKRGKDSKQTIALRMKNAKLEIEKVEQLEYYQRMLNSDLEETKKELIKKINQIYGLELVLK